MHPPSNATHSGDPFELAQQAATEIRHQTQVDQHQVVVTLGSGLASAATLLGTRGKPLDLAALPGFAPFTALGHQAEAWSVSQGGVRVLVVAGRRHLYEGLDPNQVTHTIRTAAACGCKTAVLTCAAGGIRPDLTPGSVVLINDHLNLTGLSPLTGIRSDHPEGGPFVDLVDCYSPRLIGRAQQLRPTLPTGVYAQLPGPHFETPAEINMLARSGADMVGMSVALEVIAARHLDVEVLGLAVITNPAAGLSRGPMSVEDMTATAARSVESVADIINALLVDGSFSV
jgi:purine-nucleoside phosphorylase